MKIYTLSEAKNENYLNSTKKRGGHVPNVSEMKDTVLQDGVDIDAMLYSSTRHSYTNVERNN